MSTPLPLPFLALFIYLFVIITIIIITVTIICISLSLVESSGRLSWVRAVLPIPEIFLCPDNGLAS